MTYHTIRTILGIPFRVRSPSLFEIDGRAYASSFIEICVVWYAEHAWHANVLMKDGASHYRGPFQYRDSAVAAIAQPTTGRAA